MKEIKRTFIIGEEWLYLKLYCGNYSADYVLSTEIQLIVNKLFRKKLIDHWFYTRYNDPENHLRIRFHLTNCKNIQKILRLTNSYFIKLIEKDIVYDVIVATYKREMERYGESTIIEVEKLFHYHSKRTIILIDGARNLEYDEISRIFASLFMMDELFKTFEITLDQCQSVIEATYFQFKLEYNIDKDSTKKMSQLYLSYKNDISALLKDGQDPPYLNGFIGIVKMEQKEIEIVKIILDKIRRHNKIFCLELIVSLIHMNINRIFRSKQRQYEMLCYFFMNQYYKRAIFQK